MCFPYALKAAFALCFCNVFSTTLRYRLGPIIFLREGGEAGHLIPLSWSGPGLHRLRWERGVPWATGVRRLAFTTSTSCSSC